MTIKKKIDTLDESDKFITYDIGLAAAVVTLGYDLWDVDKSNQKKSKFIFRRDEHIELN